MVYFGTRISENMSIREPEGYLFCLNVPVARTGTQDYLPSELGLDVGILSTHSEPKAEGARGAGHSAACVGSRPESPRNISVSRPEAEGVWGRPESPQMISVYRPEEEVFSPETIASFEGMPVTDDHPHAEKGVTLANVQALGKGHACNIRRGTGEQSDLLLADLIIQDKHLIHEILEEGKREISCGYTYVLSEENGVFVQRRIRGNHIAVVDAGRAGPRVCIHDHRPRTEGKIPCTGCGRCHHHFIHERSTPMKNILTKFLTRMAKDGEPLSQALTRMVADGEGELVAEVIQELLTPEAAEAPAEAVLEAVVEAVAEEPAPEEPIALAVPEGHEVTIDSDLAAQILARLDQLVALLTPAEAPAPVQDDDPEAVIQEMTELVEQAMETLEATEPEGEEAPALEATEEIAEMLETIAAPVSTVLEPEEDCDDPQAAGASDALRAAFHALRPALAKLPKEQRAKVCGDIAARLRAGDRRPAGGQKGTYAALAQARAKDARRADPAELGRRITATRNANARRG